MVAAGQVLARVVRLRLCVLGMMLGVGNWAAFLPEVSCSGGICMGFDVEECVGCGVRVVCDGLERCCGVSVVCNIICGVGCEVRRGAFWEHLNAWS